MRADHKGSWARNSPDWLVENAASGGANNPGAAGLNAVTDLFNDTQSGNYLHVYEVYIQNSGAFSCRVQHVFGNCGGVTGPCWPVVAGGAQLEGSLFINQLASIDRPNVDPYITSVNAPVVDIVKPGGPIAVLPPGFSLRVANNQTQFGFICWFYYVVKPRRT